MKQRPPATDLSGPEASAESLTARSTNLAEDDAVDLHPGLLSYVAALAPIVSFLTLGPSPSCSRPPPVETRGSGFGSKPDEPTLSSRPPGPGLSSLRLILLNRRLTDSITMRRTNLAEDDTVDVHSGLFSSAAALAPIISFPTLGPFPSCLRPPPAETQGSGCGNMLDEPTLSLRPPTPGLSPLRLLLPKR